MIPEPQKTYLLELLIALGTSAEDFVLAGAQSMKFTLRGASATRDFDSLLDVVRLRERDWWHKANTRFSRLPGCP